VAFSLKRPDGTAGAPSVIIFALAGNTVTGRE
jgi:hypothetical protein